jgi:hypothetical protein
MAGCRVILIDLERTADVLKKWLIRNDSGCVDLVGSAFLFLLAALIRVAIAAFEFDHYRRTDGLQFFPEKIRKVAFIYCGDFIDHIAMDDYPRRIHATLMRISQFYPATIHQWRLMRLHGLLE